MKIFTFTYEMVFSAILESKSFAELILLFKYLTETSVKFIKARNAPLIFPY